MAESGSTPQGETLAEVRWFATTHWSVIFAANQGDSPTGGAALERLCRSYWQPLYSFVRCKGYSEADAQDLTQEFFQRLLKKHI